ncbi:hypothetical protein [Actinotalea sp. C106]|uniref:hypothetical protein n=1 Tax=Actinotalea sp. C106 TaxID=2908644 RepID=UPI002027ED9D|nr:hypothetical protein [Actinotalea sp. C106]
MTSTTRTRPSRTIRLTAISIAATGICVAGAGLAAATNPGSSFGQAVGSAAEAVGVDWSSMPDGYSQAQYEAFWDAGYTSADVVELAELWQIDDTDTKARAGQMILDGEQLPFAPGTHTLSGVPDEALPALEEFWAAGYTVEDVQALSDLWNTDPVETKTLAGQVLLDGETLPVEPSGTPTATTSN